MVTQPRRFVESKRIWGVIAKAKLEELIPINSLITLTSTKTEEFGRWLAEVTLKERGSLTEYLISLGYGLPWDGKGKRPVFEIGAAYPIIRTR